MAGAVLPTGGLVMDRQGRTARERQGESRKHAERGVPRGEPPTC